MTIKEGDKVPSVTLQHMTADGIQQVSTDEFFKGKRVVVVGVPGAFTPVCSTKHLPGFVQNADAIKAKGIDTIACISVNDAFVMDSWGKEQNTDDEILMLADGNADFAKAAGFEWDVSKFGMGLRSRRFAMLVEDGVVKNLLLEEGTGLDISAAENLLDKL